MNFWTILRPVLGPLGIALPYRLIAAPVAFFYFWAGALSYQGFWLLHPDSAGNFAGANQPEVCS